MYRKQVFIIIGGLVGCIAVLATIYAFSPLNRKIYRSSFNRSFINEPYLAQKAVLDMGYASYYFAGSTNNHFYLGNWSAPLHLLITNTHLTDTQHVSISIKNSHAVKDYGKFRLKVDSPFFYLMHGHMPALFRGSLDNPQADQFMPSDSAYFIDAVPINPSSFALRSYSSMSNSFELGIETADTPYFQFKHELLQKQIDGLFCVEGTLHYNHKLNQLIYLYSYRNQYIVMDDKLNLINRYNTIDTFRHALVKVAHVDSKNYSTLATPPSQINGHSSTNGSYLFVQSNLLAKNENEENLKKSVVIDVYNIKEGTYVHSFYLPNYKNKKISGFHVRNNDLAAMYDRYLILYSFSDNKFTDFINNQGD